jgi:hypothetical protein
MVSAEIRKSHWSACARNVGKAVLMEARGNMGCDIPHFVLVLRIFFFPLCGSLKKIGRHLIRESGRLNRVTQRQMYA